MEASQTYEILRGQYGPDWRRQLAESVASTRQPVRHKRLPPVVVDLSEYYKLCGRSADGPSRAAQRYPAVAASIALEQAFSEQLRLLVLAGVPTGDIAERLVTEPATVELWEQVFFDVRELRQNVTFLAARVIEPVAQAGDAALASRMKLAVAGGPVVVNALLDADARLPLEETERLFQQKLLLAAKLQEAITLPLDSNAEKLKFINMHLNHEIAQRLALQERKLAELIANNHERLTLQRERSAERRAEQQRKAAARQATKAQRLQQQVQRAASVEQMRRLAEDRHQERIAASPLAKLTWKSRRATRPEEDFWPAGVTEDDKLFDYVDDEITPALVLGVPA